MNAQLAEAGTVIGGKYEVERLLGQGGMGAVYVVRHTITGKRLALKQLLPGSVDSHNDRFVREARAAGRIQHRHVVDIFDVGSDASGLYMVMELLEGKSLADMLQDEGRTLQEVLLVLSRAMQGVAAAHACGVIHRDLKPDNIFVCQGPSGQLDDPRVLDFGISKTLADPNLTESGAMLGTPYYMSPEQVYARRDIDERVDVYAMGVILYEAIAGRRPFEAEHVSALAVMIATAQPPDLREQRPDVPQALCAVVEKALSREREDRYPSMDALAQAIEPFIPRTSDLSVPPDQALPLRTPRSGSAATRLAVAPTEASVPPRPSPKPARAGWKWAVMAALLAGLAALGVWVSNGRDRSGVESSETEVEPPKADLAARAEEPARPSTPRGAEAPAMQASAESEALATSEEQSGVAVDEPSGAAGAQPVEDESAETETDTGSPGVARTRGERGRLPPRRSHRSTPTAARTAKPTAPSQANDPSTAEAPMGDPVGEAHGRAGTLGVDDF